MKILKGHRCCGKTSYAIKEAFKTNAILVTGNVNMKRFIEDTATEMHMPIKVMTARELCSSSNSRYNGQIRNKVIIDQLEWVLYEMFRNYEITDVLTDVDVFYNEEWSKKSILEKLKRKWRFRNVR